MVLWGPEKYGGVSGFGAQQAALAAPAPAAPGAAQGAAQGAAAEPQQLLGWITFEERLRMI